MSQACEIEDLRDINVSERDIKGYRFELETDSVLHSLKIEYLSNPLQSIELWKRYQGKGSDFKIPSWNWELEAKYSEGKVFPSWIDRDWIPRFKNGTFRVTVHNKGMKLSTNSLERCFIHDIYLIEIGYLRYVLKAEIKARSRANKLNEANSTKNSSTKNSSTKNSSTKNSSTKNTSAQNNGTKNSGSKNVNSKDGIENDGARTKVKTKSPTLNDYNPVPSETTGYENNLNLKNESLKIRAKKRETENNEARTEEDIQSSTFKFKLRTKLAKIGRFLGETMNLLKNLWYNRYGSVTLANWIPVKLKTKNKISRARSQKLFPCPFRVVVICPYHSQFYACFLLVFYEYVKRLLKYGCYDEDKIYSRAKSYLLHKMWIYKNHILAKCKCKPKSIIDDEIVDRQFRTPLSSFEPCKNYRCTFMINKKTCPYLIAIKKTSIKPRQLKLVGFMNGGL
jgi:hypothetical protein